MKAEAFELARQLEDGYWWFRARREILCDLVCRTTPPSGDLLDYGCGTGATAERLQALGYRVLAADLADAALEACGARGLATLDLRRHPPRERSADCVLLGDVLEHCEDDVGLLRSLAPALRPGARLVATVPAFDLLWSGEDHVSGHVRRYTRPALVRALAGAGYRVCWCSYFNTLLLPAVTAVVLYRRLFRPDALLRSDLRPLAPWLNHVLYRVFRSERWLLRKVALPVGASIVAVARIA